MTTNPTPTPAGAQEAFSGLLTAQQIEVLDRALEADGCHGFFTDHGTWIAAVNDALRETAERAWNEGYTSGHSNAMRRMSDEPNAPTSPNPYATKEPDHG